jgi:hypothetical protein
MCTSNHKMSCSERQILRFAWCITLVLMLGAVAVMPAQAAAGPTITGGGSASDMTRFALAIQGGSGHFECLMPGIMTVEASVTDVTAVSATQPLSASFTGVAAVTLAAHTPFGPPGPMVRNAPFQASVTAGGPGQGFVDLKIMGMDFAGTVEHGRISITPGG